MECSTLRLAHSTLHFTPHFWILGSCQTAKCKQEGPEQKSKDSGFLIRPLLFSASKAEESRILWSGLESPGCTWTGRQPVFACQSNPFASGARLSVKWSASQPDSYWFWTFSGNRRAWNNNRHIWIFLADLVMHDVSPPMLSSPVFKDQDIK